MGYVYKGNRPLEAAKPYKARPERKKPMPEPKVWKDPEEGWEHGTPKGWGRHRRRKEKPCEDCRAAFNAYQRTVPSYQKRIEERSMRTKEARENAKVIQSSREV